MNKKVSVYDNTVSARTYIGYIAEQAGGFATIGRDGKLYIKTIGSSKAELSLKYFRNFKWGEKIRITRVRYEDGIQLFEKGNTTGNTIYINQDNMYIVDKEQIENIYEVYKDLEIYSFEGESIIDPALDIGDILTIDGKKVIYQGSNEYQGKFKANISSKIQGKSKEETMNRGPTQKTINRRVQSRIDQTEGMIEQVTSEVDEQNQKISKVTQTVDELRSSISDIADLTISAKSHGQVSLENVNESEPIRIVVQPIGEDISYLYPKNAIYPSNNLYLKNRKIRFATDKYEIDWEIPNDLLYNDVQNYDELILDYEAQSCLVNKKMGYNADGTTYILSEQKTIEYAYPQIPLQEGDYTVSLPSYSTPYIFVRLMSKNLYTTQFATKAEVNSQINQTTQDIEIGVEQKLSNYSTIQETNSAIQLKANEITSVVSKKIGEDEIISKINQSAEEIKINADKVDIDGKAVHFKTNLITIIGPFTQDDLYKIRKHIIEMETLSGSEFERLDVTGDGVIDLIDNLLVKLAVDNGGYYTLSGTYEINPYSTNKSIALYDDRGYYKVIISLMYNFFNHLIVGTLETELDEDKIKAGVLSNRFYIEQEEGEKSVYIHINEWDNKPSSIIELKSSGTLATLVSQNDIAFLELSRNNIKSTVISTEGITIQERQVQSSQVLYDNTSGTTGTITLSESSANFTYLELFYGWGAEKSVKVSKPNGKMVELKTGLYNNNTTIQKFKRMKISETTISLVSDYVGSLNTWDNSVSTENAIIVYKVVGYK